MHDRAPGAGAGRERVVAEEDNHGGCGLITLAGSGEEHTVVWRHDVQPGTSTQVPLQEEGACSQARWCRWSLSALSQNASTHVLDLVVVAAAVHEDEKLEEDV